MYGEIVTFEKRIEANGSGYPKKRDRLILFGSDTRISEGTKEPVREREPEFRLETLI